MNECHAAARELNASPTAQAAARVVGLGSAVVHTLTHSLGLFFYAAAAVAYDCVGFDASDEVYAQIAVEVCLIFALVAYPGCVFFMFFIIVSLCIM